MTADTFHKASPMERLAEKLANDVQTLSKYLHSTGQPSPSFDQSSPSVVLPEGTPEHVQIARDHVMDYALQIFQLAAGPSEYLANLQTGYHYLACLQWLCHFKIFDLVPLDGSITYSELAILANVAESYLKSVTRMAMTNRLFTESMPQHISHSATSALLRTNQDFRDWAVFMCDISMPTASAMVKAHQTWPQSVEKNHTAYSVAFQTDLPFFQHLAQLPERHRQFAGYMRSVTTSQGTHLKHLLNGFNWAGLGKALVVDVGGSTGHASMALAKAHADLNFIVQDLPEVISGAELQQQQQLGNAAAASSLGDQEEDVPPLTQRIKFQAYNFFEKQPTSGADVYLLRMILHDWSFDEAVRILSNIIPALKKDSMIIIMDTVLPDPGSIPAAQERLLRVRDLTMMQVFNSQERAIEDWLAIFDRVDSRLKMRNLTRPFGSVMALMELVLEA